MVPNQNPEQIARDNIDDMLKASGWSVQDNKKIDFTQGQGQAVREYQTDIGPADYVLFVDKKPVGVIEAKKEDLEELIDSIGSKDKDVVDFFIEAFKKSINSPKLIDDRIFDALSGKDPDLFVRARNYYLNFLNR